MSGTDMNARIRAAAGYGSALSSELVLAPIETIGSAGVGRGGTAAGRRPPTAPNEEINESIRRQRAVLRGHADITDLLNL
jgi:hypothetical protein